MGGDKISSRNFAKPKILKCEGFEKKLLIKKTNLLINENQSQIKFEKSLSQRVFWKLPVNIGDS